MVVSGKDMDKWKSDEPAIIIMNHRTRLDWMFFWAFMLRFGSLRRLKIILKEQLKLVPGLGWAMQNFVFIFIKRKWEQDEQYLSDVFSHYSRHHYPIQLLLFPEGTDFSHANREKNKTYEEKNGLPHLKNLLHPRVKGFKKSVDSLRSTVDAVWDVTLGFPDYVPETEKSLLEGKFPQEVHFHVKRYDIKDAPSEEGEFQEWCTKLWKEKDQLLEEFYNDKHFHDQQPPVEPLFVRLTLSIASMMIMVISLIYAMYTYQVLFVYFVIVCCMYQIITHWKGVDHLEISYCKSNQ